MVDSYRGVFGAIPFAIRRTESWTMRVYGVVGTLFAALIAVTTTLALVTWMGETADIEGGLFLVTRAMYVLIGFAAVAPLLAPLLLVARRHRRSQNVSPDYDRWLALAGFGFLGSLYLGLLVSAPSELREPTGSVFVGTLYALPPIAGLVPPTLAGIGIYLVHRRFSRSETGTSDDEE